MLKKIFIFSALFVLMISLAGCATCRKQNQEVQGLKNQLVTLQSESQAKDEEINNLREALSRQPQAPEAQTAAKTVVTRKKVIMEAKSRPKAKQIQTALVNAGFDPGPVDGRMGKKTIEAIKAFQKAHSLPVDGKVGKRTWSFLRQYLSVKLK